MGYPDKIYRIQTKQSVNCMTDAVVWNDVIDERLQLCVGCVVRYLPDEKSVCAEIGLRRLKKRKLIFSVLETIINVLFKTFSIQYFEIRVKASFFVIKSDY